jgi:hypothetical protein
MDTTEAHVEKYLVHRGHAKVDHHPDGRGSPPDFLVDGRIAVEVRRLDKNYTDGGKRQSLDQAAKPLLEIFQELLPSFGPPTTGESWYVMYDLRRPIDSWKVVKSQLRQTLATFKASPSVSAGEIKVCRGLTVEFRPTSKLYRAFFVLASPGDDDAGGWVVAEIIDNLKLCIAEKTPKVAHVRSKYPEWWLVLVNQIDPLLDAVDMQEVRAHVPRPGTWNRVIPVSSNDHTRAIEP